MTAQQHMPVLAGDPKAVRRAREDELVAQYNRQTKAAYETDKKARAR